MKKYLLILMVLFFGIKNIEAQRTEDPINFPMTPQATALFKAIAAPVSYYTGQPDISIPIYTISQDGVDVPISISFNTSGIFVNEEATSIGIGARLNWGGSIVRSTNGQADERGFFTENYRIATLNQELPKNYNNTSSAIFFPWNGFPESLVTVKARENEYANMDSYNDPYANGNGNVISSDLRPDDFHYNILGKSGLFKFNQADRKFITFPLDDIKINKTVINGYLQNFEIIRSDGVRAILGDDAEEFSTKENNNVYTNYNQKVVQSWFVKKIITLKNTVIDFSYVNNQYIHTTESKTLTYIPPKPYVSAEETYISGDTYTTTEKLIKTISFKEGKLDFIYVNDRADFPNTIVSSSEVKPAPRLSQIIVSDSKNNIIKSFQLHQSYFTGASNIINLNSRLRLDSLSINDNQSKKIERFKFEYYDSEVIPSKKEIAINKDLWGYYNNSSSNRYINSDVNKLFTLKKITFPTGAQRTYLFENNSVPWTNQYFGKLKDISNDWIGQYEINFNTGGTSLDTSSGNPIVSGAPYNNVLTVYQDAFTTQGDKDIYSENIILSIETSYINTGITLSALNLWPYNIEIGIQKKTDNAFTNYFSTTIDRYSSNVSSYNKISRQINSMPNGVYRIYVQMTAPPTYVMKNWAFRPGHITKVKLEYSKKNFNDIRVGGLRIKEITDREKNNEYKTAYQYVGLNNFCSGQLITAPEYKEYVSQRIIKPGQYDSQGNPEATNYYGARISSEPIFSLLKTQGSNVGYTNVIKKQTNGTEEIKEEFTFSFTPSQREGYLKEYYQEFEPKQWQNGKLLSNKKYKNNVLINEETFDYYGLSNETDKGFIEEINTNLINPGDLYDIKIDRRFNNPLMFGNPPQRLINITNLYGADNLTSIYFNNSLWMLSPPTKIPYFKIYTGFDKLKSKTTIDYFGSNNVSQTENYYYNTSPTSLQLTYQTTTNSKGETLETKYFYPQDPQMASEPFVKELIAENRIGTPLNVQTFRGGNKLSEQKTVYDKSIATSNLLLPKEILSNKGTATLSPVTDKKISYDLYDDKGNLLQYTQEGAPPTSIVWGYNKTLPVAKIENIEYKKIPASLINEAQNASSNNGSEASMLTAFNKFTYSYSLELNNTIITSYIHKPLIGVSRITDPSGMSTYYNYDNANRLQHIKDQDLNILQTNYYHYKGQVIDYTLAAPRYSNVEIMRKIYTKNDCPAGATGTQILYNIVPAGMFESLISQADANDKAQKDMDIKGQAFANEWGSCNFMNVEKSGVFTKNNCIEGTTGDPIKYTVAAQKYSSQISQADADAQAQADVNKNGQAYANANAICFYKNNTASKLFSKNDCGINGVPDSMYYTVEAGKYRSQVSQADADAKAQNDININGQTYVNANTHCTYKNKEIKGYFIMRTPPWWWYDEDIFVYYYIPTGRYSSIYSENDANTIAGITYLKCRDQFICEIEECRPPLSQKLEEEPKDCDTILTIVDFEEIDFTLPFEWK